MASGATSGPDQPALDIAVLEALEADTSRELIPELVAVFVKSANERRARIDANVASGNLDGVAAEAHALKSSSATFGAMEVRRVSADLESAGKAGDRLTSERLVTELGHALDAATQALDAYITDITC